MSEDHIELRVPDALSAVLIREHKVTAVVAHYSETQASHGQSRYEWGWKYTIAIYPRSLKINGHTDSLMNLTPLPILGDHQNEVPGELVDVAKENGLVLEIFLKTHW